MKDIDINENDRKKQIRIRLFLVLMILLQSAIIIYCFSVKKQGFHSDEMWSYGYANSYYQKDVYQTMDNEPLNVGEWKKGQVLKDYLVVNDGERFQYGSIYQNQIIDLSPPFHSMLLHTICSFFPNSFSAWYAFVINLVSFWVTMIFLFKVSCLLSSESNAIWISAIYGFCRSAIDNFSYLRMYAFCTALLLVIVYYFLKFIKDDKGTPFWKTMLPLFFVSLIAFLTHYYMLSTCGIMTALFCVYLLFSKKIKKMFQLGFTMLFAFLASVAIFPSLLYRARTQTEAVVNSNAKMQNYDFNMRTRVLWNFITSKSVGIKISIFRSYWYMYALGYVVFIIIMAIPIIFLFRKSKFILMVKDKIIYFVKNFKNCIKKAFHFVVEKTNWFAVILAIVCILQVTVVGETSRVYGMGEFEDRYLFYLVPFFLIVVVSLATCIVNWILRKNKVQYIIYVAICGFIIFTNLRVGLVDSSYYFAKKNSGESLETVCKGQNVVYIESVPWLLTAMAPNLMNCNEYILLAPKECAKKENEIKEKLKEGPVYVVIDTAPYLSRLNELSDKVELSTSNNSDLGDYSEDYYKLLDYFVSLSTDGQIYKVTRETVLMRDMQVFMLKSAE